jgi:ribonuclease E
MSNQPKRELIINYVPGEECRVAVVQGGKLEEFYSERRDAISHVGNIYVGRVTNVEPAIQAAFVEFGLDQAGFLHTSDVHPRYFPGEDAETTERVGKKTPRRERPPIQECFRRGDEVIVQVLKEGVGSKGPTVTSYLSIPGRYLVMMPGMDRVGVSRKVEDEELRTKMKAILDQLELPEGFGFIVRTAGLDKSKTELKRDLAYLVRLQKDMERRRKSGSKPRLLYSESDLLVRSLRDMITGETERVVIDSAPAVERAARFLKIVSPRSTTRIVHYTGNTPIFHAMGVEEQIRNIYSREVPLPSGGRLVIDETEALVAIDVNSGKHRDASDSETNALKTNLEAVEEIARQLRLRDLGGIVVNDLIDMRAARHRKEVESKFEELMKNDRARSTLASISEFGVLEMTRQRMRGSHESQHFHDCPMCRGRGLIQKADSVAADALREAAAILDHDRVARVEMVVNPRIAGELLSGKRMALLRLEKRMGKPVSVRLSDATPLDRVSLYAYDASGNDVDVDRLPRYRLTDQVLKAWEDAGADAEILEEEEQFDFGPEIDHAPADEPHPIESAGGPEDLEGPNLSLEAARRGGKRGRGRRGRGGKGEGRGDGRDQGRAEGRGEGRGRAPDRISPEHSPHRQDVRPVTGVAPAAISGPRMVIEPAPGDAEAGAPAGEPGRQGEDFGPHDGDHADGPPQLGPDGQPLPDSERRGRRRRRRRRGRGGAGGGQSDAPVGAAMGPGGAPAPRSAPVFDDGDGFFDPRPVDEAPLPMGDGTPSMPVPMPAGGFAPGTMMPADDTLDDGSDGPEGADGPDGDDADGFGPGQPGEGSAGEPRLGPDGQPLPDSERRGRRRRRRRRGRGGRGGPGGPGAEGGAGPIDGGAPAGEPGVRPSPVGAAPVDGPGPADAPRPPRPPRNDRREGRRDDRRDGRPRDDRPREPAVNQGFVPPPPRPAPPPASPAPEPKPLGGEPAPAAPKPRSLYGFNRKLKPGEIGRIKRD